ncbi:alpha/beta fold hydrolase, partial [Kitasatospora sp. NPDC057541]|uniref:alpha/beta fold hydrolase n=1 Tax=Kitasatospora sp. NPDC057541 TaxID=3346161 RepID=UPI003680321F
GGGPSRGVGRAFAHLRGAGLAGPGGAHRPRRAAAPSPVLVVAGAEDGVAGVDKPRHVASCYPAGRLEVLAGSGHWPWVDEPTAFRDLVTGFLAD